MNEIKDTCGLKGTLNLEIVRANGTREYRHVPNTIVSIGKSQVAGYIVSDVNVGSAIDNMAIGLGSDTITAGDSILGSEAYKVATAGTRTITTVTNDTARFIGSFTIDATKTINEAGLFNKVGLNTGSMLARTVFADIVTGSEDNINATWDIAVS